MKTMILALALFSPAAFALPSTTTLTCAQASALVSARGAVVLATGGQTYDRFVSHQGYCATGEVARPAWAPTRDSAQCFVGYVCGQNNSNGNN